MKGDGQIAPGIVAQAGKPYVNGTQVEVATVLRDLASGGSREKVLKRLGVSEVDIQAALGYASEIVADELEMQRARANRNQGTVELAPGITADRDLRFGNPVIKGTRIDVALVLDHLAAGWTLEELLGAYSLTRTKVGFVLRYAAEIIERETVFAASG